MIDFLEKSLQGVDDEWLLELLARKGIVMPGEEKENPQPPPRENAENARETAVPPVPERKKRGAGAVERPKERGAAGALPPLPSEKSPLGQNSLTLPPKRKTAGERSASRPPRDDLTESLPPQERDGTQAFALPPPKGVEPLFTRMQESRRKLTLAQSEVRGRRWETSLPLDLEGVLPTADPMAVDRLAEREARRYDRGFSLF